MRRNDFNQLKTDVANASPAETLELEYLIQQVVAQRFVEMALARRTRTVRETRICPHCAGNNVVLHGKDKNDRQRFKCRSCKRTYNILTGTSMARARKPEKWGSYLNFMTQHTAVRAIRTAGIGLNHVTIWRWRHRFLEAAAHDRATLLCGVIEVDTMFFRYSFKGRRVRDKAARPEICAARSGSVEATRERLPFPQVPVLTALDSSGGIVETILASINDIGTALQGRIVAGSVLCSDDRAAYARVAKRADAEAWVISARPGTGALAEENLIGRPSGVRKNLGLRRVRGHQQQFRHLVNNRCRGVATRYLRNYLGWHRAMVRPGFVGKALLAGALGS